ncbi:MAG TPA: hypothetical protein PK400_01335 [Phycisphaerales bacterium]|nr:hypothetical protein [Phycisphaerales bacterium]HRQ74870.1 hypothetical protein [Phycisphaerales bacterium]
MKNSIRTILSRTAMLPLIAMPTLVVSSCNIVGPAAYIVAGPPTVDAEYKLQDRPTVVFIDDRENLINPVSLRRVLADRVSQELMTRKLVTRTISPQDAMGLASRYDTNREVMPIDAIGRAVGAEQVLFIEILAFSDRVDNTIPRAAAVVRVRLIDVENRVRLYPSADSEQVGRVVQITTREFPPDAYQSRSSRVKIYETLAQDSGDRIAKLFYKHEARELGGSLRTK